MMTSGSVVNQPASQRPNKLNKTAPMHMTPAAMPNPLKPIRRSRSRSPAPKAWPSFRLVAKASPSGTMNILEA